MPLGCTLPWAGQAKGDLMVVVVVVVVVVGYPR